MRRFFATAVFCLSAAVIAPAATVTTTITMTNGTLALSQSGSATINGPVTMTNIGSGGATVSGTMAASATLASIQGQNIVAPFTITFTGGDTLKGNLTVPASLLGGGTFDSTGSLAFTGGTGAYAGASGTITASGSASGPGPLSYTLNFTGTGSLTLPGSTGGTGGGNTPTVSAILDAASNTSGLAAGTYFIVKGTNLSASGYVQNTTFPIPTVLNNVKITFTPAAGGSSTDALMFYTYNQSGVNQLAAVLPSTVAPGNYNVMVTNGTQVSATFTATVVASKFEAFTQDTTGSGLAVAQNYVSTENPPVDLNRLTTGIISGTTTSPAHPGQLVIVYGTGLGAVPFDDSKATPNSGYNFLDHGYTVQAIVGGKAYAAAYAGRVATLTAEDAIYFTLSSDVPTGCSVPLQFNINGTLSATTALSIAPDASSTTCVQPGFTTAQLQDLDSGKSINAGAFSLTQLAISIPQQGTVKEDSISGGFTQITAFNLGSASQLNVSSNTQGACKVFHTSGKGSAASAGPTVNGLDAGAITLTGPAGSNLTTGAALTEDPTSFNYSLSLGTEGFSIPGSVNAVLTPGAYTLNGAGGTQVGQFNVSVNLGTPLTLGGSGIPATVVRASGLPLTWTGGNTSDQVQIIGISGTSTSNSFDATEFVCTTTAGTGGFTVPASVLNQLPVTPSTSAGGTGFVEVTSGPAPASFSPTLTGDGTIPSTFSALIGTGAIVSFQ